LIVVKKEDFMKKTIVTCVMVVLALTTSAVAGEIHQAARAGDLAKVKSLLATDRGLLNSRDQRGFTPLHSAISKGREPVVSYLIRRGADVDARNKNGLSPVFQALDLSKNRIAALLIRNGANINGKGFRNRTLLHMAARSGNRAIADLLIRKGVPINAVDSRGDTPLDLTIKSLHAETADLILQKGGKINRFKPGLPESKDLLNRAIISANIKYFRVLSRLGIKLNQSFDNGHYLVHKAAALGWAALVKLLIGNGVDVHLKTSAGQTPVYFAAKYGHKEIVDFLISKGADATGIDEMHYGNFFLDGLNIKQGEAYIWYLNHSAWAIKTKNHFLIFDYVGRGNKPLAAFLSAGYITPSELKGLNTSVFVSHGHGDHYDPGIYKWKDSIENIHYILGFKPARVHTGAYHYLPPRTRKKMNGMEIITLKSTDSGVAFLVKVDGLTIYHAGDHANVRESQTELYQREIDFLAKEQKGIDLAFVVSGAGCGGRGGTSRCVLRGNNYAIKKLLPGVVFPMHSGGNERVYRQFKKDAAGQNEKTNIITATYRGDSFFYTAGRIQPQN
jgi:ankyrin repeat protein